MPKKNRKPSYLLHKPSGQARVRIDGKDHYLGEYGSPESRDRYDELIAEWFAKQNADGVSLRIDELAIRFMAHANEYYRTLNGEPTGEADNYRRALRYLVGEFGRTRVREFGPVKFKAVREAMVKAGLCRSHINRQASRIKTVFSWAVENELAPTGVVQALREVAGLRAGRTAAHEAPPVVPVDAETVDATLKHLPEVVADMVRLQLLTGARPGEICCMRPGDIEREKDVWTYRPGQHKTAHRGKERRIFIGPRGQEILRPYLLRAADSYCFSPAESERKRTAKRRKSRSKPSRAASRGKRRKYRDRYTKDSYRRAVQYGCEAAFGMPAEQRKIKNNGPERKRLQKRAAAWRSEHCWSPNQLRHSRATVLREKYGIEAAQVVLGHSDPKTTLVYAEAQFAKAAEIAKAIG